MVRVRLVGEKGKERDDNTSISIKTNRHNLEDSCPLLSHNLISTNFQKYHKKSITKHL